MDPGSNPTRGNPSKIGTLYRRQNLKIYNKYRKFADGSKGRKAQKKNDSKLADQIFYRMKNIFYGFILDCGQWQDYSGLRNKS